MYRILLIILILFCIVSCNNVVDVPVVEGEVVFSFQGSKVLSKATNVLSEALVSIKDERGMFVYNAESIKLYNFSGDLISEPLSLVEGAYTLVKFMIIDEKGNVIYATPMEDSPYSHLVDDPLPIYFKAAGDEVTKLIPEVITTENGTPEDFGYSSFGVEIVDIVKFAIIVFDAGNLVQISADLNIDGDHNNLYSGTIGEIAGPDTITILGGYVDYDLTVAKKRYRKYNHTFTADSLKKHYDEPLKIFLKRK